MTVNATGGSVSSTGSQGIRVSGSGALTVSAVGVTGHSTGIYAKGVGSGAVSVRARGAVVGMEEHGIDAAGRGVSVSAVSVKGNKYGIRASGAGGGDVSVVVTGAVETSKGNGDGIRATNDASGSALTVRAAAVQGERHGIWAKNEGNGRLQVSASGPVAGREQAGIYARSDRADLSITAAAATGKSAGIHAVSAGGGAIGITARGAVTASSGHGVHAVGSGSGAVSVSASSAEGRGRNRHGIYAEASAAMTVSAGAAVGDAVGIRVKASGNGAIGVGATGAVTGRSGHGIHVSGGGNMTIRAAAVTGGSGGVVAANSGGGTIDFRASGAVSGASGHGIELTGSGAITLNAAGGAVSGEGSGKHGILASGAGGVSVSAGTVTGSAIGIDARSASGSVRIGAAGAVSGGTGFGIYARAGASGLSISAATVSGGSTGISAVSAGGGAIGISVAGSVSGGAGHGIRAAGSGSGPVSVNASGAVAGSGPGNDGITVSGSGNLAVSAAAVSGAAAGIRVVGSGSGSVRVAASGAVAGGADGIHVANAGGGAVSISAAGAVTGSAANAAGIRATNGAGGTVVTVIADSVRGTQHGIWVDNSGSGATDVEVQGSVSGSVGHGIRVKGREAINIAVGGNISGGTASGMAAIHSDSSAGKNVSIALNNGADVGETERGLAILDGAGNARVTILAGANVSGDVSLGSGADNLIFEGGAMTGGALLGGDGVDTLRVGSSGNVGAARVAEWESIEIEAGATLAVSDLNAQNILARGTLSLSDGTTSSATIAGNFIGGGTLIVDVDMAQRKADVLTVQGDVSGRPTAVVARGAGGLASQGEGVLFARVEGEVVASGASQAFVDGDAGSGGGVFSYRYTVEGDDSGGDTEFFLKAVAGSLNEVGAAMTKAASTLASGFARTPSAAARGAARTSASAGRREVGQAAFGQNPSAGSRAIWTRIHSSRIDHGTGPNGDSAETAASGFQLGSDLLFVEAESGEWVFGVTGQYGSSTLEAKTPFGTGTVESAGFGLGVGATWHGESGLYADVQAQFNQTESDYASSTEGTIKSGSESATTVASVEIGRRLDALDFLGDAVLTSNGKLSWASISGDSFTTSGANPLEVDFGSDSILTAGVGMAAEFDLEAGLFRISSSVSRDIGDAPDVVIDGVTYGGGDPLTRLEFGVGGLMSVGESSALMFNAEFWSGSGGDADESGSMLSGSMRWSW